MRSLTLPTCVFVALVSGIGLLRVVSQGALRPRFGLAVHHAWPLAVMGVGLLLAGASLAVHGGLHDRGLLFLRGARLTFLGGLTVGTTLALLGLLAALTLLL